MNLPRRLPIFEEFSRQLELDFKTKPIKYNFVICKLRSKISNLIIKKFDEILTSYDKDLVFKFTKGGKMVDFMGSRYERGILIKTVIGEPFLVDILTNIVNDIYPEIQIEAEFLKNPIQGKEFLK